MSQPKSRSLRSIGLVMLLSSFLAGIGPAQARVELAEPARSGTARECFEVFVEAEGMLRIELVGLDEPVRDPTLELPPREPGSSAADRSWIERRADGGLAHVREPGELVFCAFSGSASEPLGAYGVEASFAARTDLLGPAGDGHPDRSSQQKENEHEGEVDVDPLWIGTIQPSPPPEARQIPGDRAGSITSGSDWYFVLVRGREGAKGGFRLRVEAAAPR